MVVVEIPVSAAELAATLASMRSWFDHKKSNPVRFETKPEQDGVVLVQARFDTGALAEEFRRNFDPDGTSAFTAWAGDPKPSLAPGEPSRS